MLSWFGKGKKNEGGGYRKDRPPEDDCCPICFDDFHVPCRTNCGHWFCGSCILRFSRLIAKFQRCKCPICQSLIYNLVPHSPLMIQPERDKEVDEILGEIEQYNRKKKALVGFNREIRDFYSSPYRGLGFLLLHMLGCALLICIIFGICELASYMHGIE